MALLKINGKDLYFKGISKDRETLEFTDDVIEAQEFENYWFAETKLKFLKFHYPQYKEEYLNNMNIVE